MIVGCYTLDLYCDVEGCTYNLRAGQLQPSQYTGVAGTECKRAARKDGWRFQDADDGQRAICPVCAKARKIR